MIESVESRSVLVTGSSTGIGRATAIHLDGLGFRVFAAVRKQSDADTLCTLASNRLTPVFLDITDAEARSQVREQIAQAVAPGGLWGLVNNAGNSFRAPLECVPLDELRELFDVNVFGTLAVTQTFLPLLRQARGRIVNVSSAAALMVTPFHGVYSSSKACLNALSDALRMELQPLGVQVSSIMCGAVQTPLWDKVVHQTGRITRGYSPELTKLYAARQQKALDNFLARGQRGILAEVVARDIAHALTAPRPRNTYFTGPDARFYGVVDKVVHGRVRDWITLRGLGL